MSAEFRNALQSHSEEATSPVLYTGFSALDSLLGGMRQGLFYLFYGDEESSVDVLVHRVLVNSLLPPARNGFDGKAVYFNCGNYKYERTILDIELLGFLAKSSGLDPVQAFKEVYAVVAFSEDQQEVAVEEVCSLLDRDQEIKLVIIHNIAKLFTETSHTPNKRVLGKIPKLQRIVGMIFQACTKNDIALVVSARPSRTIRGRVPPCEGGKYLRQKAGVVVYLRRVGKSSQIQAFLLKHPSRPQRNTSFELKESEKMGRITLPFRIRWEKQLDDLRGTFREALMDQGRQKALDNLARVWSSELGAMSQCNVPTVLDVMLLTAVVDDRKLIAEIQNRLKSIEEKIDSLLGCV